MPLGSISPPPGFSNPMTQAQDLIVGGVAGAATRLGLGATGGMALVVSGGAAVWGQAGLAPLGTVLAAPVTLTTVAVVAMLTSPVLTVGIHKLTFQGLVTAPAIASATGLEMYLSGGTATYTVLSGPSAYSIPFPVASDNVPFTFAIFINVTVAGTVVLVGYNNATTAATLQAATQGTSARAGCSGVQDFRVS